jgi:sugar lactone lactonase YvrE
MNSVSAPRSILCCLVLLLFVGTIHASTLCGTSDESFETPGTGSQGLTFDGISFWIADSDDDKIYRLSSTGRVTRSFDSPGPSPRGLTFDGKHLWNVDSSDDRIYQLDTRGKVLSSIASPNSWAKGLTFDGAHLWYADSKDDKIYQVDTGGRIVSSFDSPDTTPRGLAFDGTHLWLANGSDGRFYKLGASGNVIATYDAPGPEPRGLTFDGQYLWNADSRVNKVFRLKLCSITPLPQRQGATSTGTPSAARFSGGATRNGGNTYGLTFKPTDTVEVIARILVDPAHAGASGSLYVVAVHEGAAYMKEKGGSWAIWDMSSALAAAEGPRRLFASEFVPVLTIDPSFSSLLLGTTSVFVGYLSSDGVVHYNSEPIRFTIAQDQVACEYKLSSTRKSFGAGEGTGSITVTATSGCSWTARSTNSWISITSGSSGNGKGTVRYSVTRNSGSKARTGQIALAGKTFTVIQEAGSAGTESCNSGFAGKWKSKTRFLCRGLYATRNIYLDIDVKSDCRFTGKFALYVPSGGFCNKVDVEKSASGQINASKRTGEIVLESKRYEFEITEKSANLMEIEVTSHSGGFSEAESILYK